MSDPVRPAPRDQSGRSRAGRFVERRLERVSKGVSRVGLYEFYDAAYADLPRGSLVLSIGAGGPIHDHLNRAARRHGFRVVTLDFSPERRPDVVADACRSPMAADSFDAVVMGEVLEHCHDPRGALGGARRCLRPGGRLILSTPFIFPIHNAPVDYWRFTRYGLELLLKDWADVEVRPRNSWPEAINVLRSRYYKSADPATRRLAAPFAAAAWAAKLPARLLGRAMPAEEATTGYVALATKPPAAG